MTKVNKMIMWPRYNKEYNQDLDKKGFYDIGKNNHYVT